MGKAVLSAAHSTGFFNEERHCGRGEELALLVEKNALRLLRRLRWGAKRRTRVARRVV